MEKRSSIAGRMLTVTEAVGEVQAGRLVILCDDEDRENEADLCQAAQFTNAGAVNFMAHQACGLICVALTGARIDMLRLPPVTDQGDPLQGTAFTTSVDARYGTTTGISAQDRATTIRALVGRATRPGDLAYPGHVFPLRARPGGTLERRGHTEAAVDLMRIAGLEPAAVICEILNEEGEAARGEKLLEMARRWNLGLLSVEAIAHYRRTRGVSRISETSLPTADATFKLLHYREIETGLDYLALVLGETRGQSRLMLRLHSACMTGDLFGSQRCDCQAQMQAALRAIINEGQGILLYLPQEGRGIGLAGKLQAYRLQEQGYDTVEANEYLGYPADARTYESAVEILDDLGVTSVRLLTNNPAKVEALRARMRSVERVALETSPTGDNLRYLQAKRQRFGHMLNILTELPVATQP